MTPCIAAPAGFAIHGNLESNGAIATTCSLPTTYRAGQLMGRAVDIRDCSLDEEARASAQLDAFMALTPLAAGG